MNSLVNTIDYIISALLKSNKDSTIDIDLKDIITKNLLLSANDISDAVSNY